MQYDVHESCLTRSDEVLKSFIAVDLNKEIEFVSDGGLQVPRLNFILNFILKCCGWTTHPSSKLVINW